MAAICHLNLLVLMKNVLFLQCVLVGGVLSCSGLWSSNRYSSQVSDSSYSYCSYGGRRLGQTPADIREDTEYLSLHYNNLIDASLSTTSIKDQVTSLLALEVNKNYLTKIPELKMFNNSLAYFSIANNQLTYFDFDHFSDFPFIRTLDCSSNRITYLNLTKPITAQYIYVDYNQLTSVDMNAFSVIPMITYLGLKYNPLTEFIYPSRDGKVNVIHLTLSSTNTINLQTPLQNMSTLLYLDLENNGITTLNLSNIHDLPNLIKLDLSHNSELTIPDQDTPIVFKYLTQLDLSYCHITDMNLTFYIRTFPELRTLSLRQNLITKIDFPGNGMYHPNLQLLYLEYNPLTSVSEYCHPYFSGYNSIYIRLQGTQLRCDACLLWLPSCPYNIHRDEPTCVSPERLSGMTLTAVTPYLIDIPCSLHKDDSSIFQKKIPTSNGNPTTSIVTKRGVQECALKTKLSKSASFQYNETSHVCDIYKDSGGNFETL